MQQINQLNVRDTLGAGMRDRQSLDANALQMDAAKQSMNLRQQNADMAQQKFSQEQQMQNTRRLYAGVKLVKKAPQLTPRILQDLSKAGVINAESVPKIMEMAQTNPEQFESMRAELEANLQYALGEVDPTLGKGDLVSYQGETGPVYGTAQDALGKAPVVGASSEAKPPASIAEYQMYRQQAASAGEQPMSFFDFKKEFEQQGAAGRTIGTVETKAEFEAERDRPRLMMAARAKINSIDSTIGGIDQAIGLANWWSTGTSAQIMEKIGATDARDLKAALQPVTAALAFDELAAMREASKTGGALGAISERELDLLAGRLRSLDTAQSTDAIIDNLKAVRGHYENLRRMQRGQEALLAGAQFVATPQEAMSLPPGTTFVDPDGRIRRVPDGR